MSHPLKQLIARGEGLHLDFKFEVSDSKKIARSLVAFANTLGGKLLLGVKDNGIVAGVRSEEEVFMIETAAHLFSKPPIPFDTQLWKLDGRTVLEVSISQSDTKPHFAKDADGKWFPWIRVTDQNILASPVMLKIWQIQKRKEGILIEFNPELRFLIRFLNKYGSILLDEFSSKTKMPMHQAEDLFARLCVVEVLKMDHSKREVRFYPGEEWDDSIFPDT